MSGGRNERETPDSPDIFLINSFTATRLSSCTGWAMQVMRGVR